MPNHVELFAIAPRIVRVPPDDPLLAPAVKRDATSVLEALRSEVTTDALSFEVTNWKHLTDGGFGPTSTVTLDDLGSWIEELGTQVAPKKQAEIFGAFTTKDGSRREDAVKEVTALVLDCDGLGSWDFLQTQLDELGYGYLFYQSPSHTEAAPKWRCLIPFDKPFVVADSQARSRWENLYLIARTVFGVAAQLLKHGFDLKTNNPERIWIVATRPTKEDPPRKVVWKNGHALNLKELLTIVPEGSITDKSQYGDTFEPSLAAMVFREAGLLGPKLSETKFAVRCPRNSEHSDPAVGEDYDSSTVIFSANNRGAFDCKHGHSRRDVSLPEMPERFDLQHALDLIEMKNPGTLEKATALLQTITAPGSILFKATQAAKVSQRAADKLRVKAKEYRQLAKLSGVPLEVQAKAQAFLAEADSVDAKANSDRLEAERLLEIVEGSFDFLDSDDDTTVATHAITTLPKAVFDQGVFYLYNERGIWKALDQEQLRYHLISKLYRKVLIRTPTPTEPSKTSPLYLNDNKLNGIVNCIYTLTSKEGFFASRKPGVAFRNGMVTVTDSLQIDFVQPEPEHAQRHFIDANYVGEIPTPRWDAFLNDVMGEAEQHLLHEFLGACLLEDAVRFQRCVALVGFGQNGKSTLLDTIKNLFPEDATAALSPTVWGKRFQISRLVSKLINIVDELPSQRVEDSDTFKKVVTGGSCETEFKNQPLFSFVSKCGHIFAVNELPKSSDLTDGWYRRWAIIMMDRRIPDEKKDVQILEKLKQELPGIASKCILGYIRLRQRGGYDIPEGSQEAALAWREESDAPLRFVRQFCEKAPDAWTSTEEIYNRYRREAQADGTPIHEQVSAILLGKTLGRAGFQPAVKNNRRGWALRFRPLAGIERAR